MINLSSNTCIILMTRMELLIFLIFAWGKS